MTARARGSTDTWLTPAFVALFTMSFRSVDRELALNRCGVATTVSFTSFEAIQAVIVSRSPSNAARWTSSERTMREDLSGHAESYLGLADLKLD